MGDRVSVRGERLATNLCGKTVHVDPSAWPKDWETDAAGRRLGEVVAVWLDYNGGVYLLLRPIVSGLPLRAVPAMACEVVSR